MTNEKELAGSNYIITFYKEIELLTHNTGLYNNILVEIKNKYGDNGIDSMDDNAKQILLGTIQTVRLGIHKSYIQYSSIKQVVKLDDDDKIKIAYNKMKDQFIIKFEDVQDYVIEINKILVNEIIENLLNTSNDLIQSMYKD